MSDTSNRGRILFLVMTNRPDKLDVDLKRAGRLDKKIPFLYSQTPEEVENVARAQVRKNHIKTNVDFATIRDDFSKKLVGYSNADVEAVILMANDDAAQQDGGDAEVKAKHFIERRPRLLPEPRRRAPRVHGAPGRLRILQPPPPPGQVREHDAGGAGRAAAAPPGDGGQSTVEPAQAARSRVCVPTGGKPMVQVPEPVAEFLRGKRIAVAACREAETARECHLPKAS